MAYVEHYQITMSGTLGIASPKESWSTGFQCGIFDDPPDPLPIPSLAWAADVVDLLVSFFGDPDTLIGNTAELTDIKIATIGTNGRVKRDEESGVYFQRHFFDMGVNGNATGNRHPFQIANVATLDTTRPGKSGKGRMYLPAPAATVDAEGQISLEQAQLCADRVAELFQGINDLASEGAAKVVVASSKGYMTAVNAVRVGRVLDTHRSRRRSLNEARQTAAVGP